MVVFVSWYFGCVLLAYSTLSHTCLFCVSRISSYGCTLTGKLMLYGLNGTYYFGCLQFLNVINKINTSSAFYLLFSDVVFGCNKHSFDMSCVSCYVALQFSAVFCMNSPCALHHLYLLLCQGSRVYSPHVTWLV